MEELEDSLAICEVYNVVLVASLISGDLLIWSISPISINSEFIHVLQRIKEFDEVVRWRLLSNLILYDSLG